MTEKQAQMLIEQIIKVVDIINFWDTVGTIFLTISIIIFIISIFISILK